MASCGKPDIIKDIAPASLKNPIPEGSMAIETDILFKDSADYYYYSPNKTVSGKFRNEYDIKLITIMDTLKIGEKNFVYLTNKSYNHNMILSMKGKDRFGNLYLLNYKKTTSYMLIGGFALHSSLNP